MTIRTYARRADYNERIDIHFVAEDGRSVRSIAQPVVFKEDEEDGAYPQPPALSLKRDDAQHLMDELWNVGLRPSEGSGSAGSLAATERHLKDMQKLAFHALKVAP